MCVCLSHSLPRVVKRRVNALKNLQVKCANIEAKFYEEVHELERKYAALYQPLYDKVRVATPLDMPSADSITRIEDYSLLLLDCVSVSVF